MKVSKKRAHWLGATIYLRCEYHYFPNEAFSVAIPITHDYLVNATIEDVTENTLLPVIKMARRYARKAMPK